MIMKVMVVDGGARGQALGAKLAQEGNDVIISPGNPGNEDFAESTGIQPTDIIGQLRAAKRNNIELTIVGADDPLAMGIVDAFEEELLAIFGPTKAQARIEWDRNFAKEIGRDRGIPMGPYAHFTDKKAAIEYTEGRSWPLYVKDNNLAQGKGAIKCENVERFQTVLSGLNDEIIVEDYVGGPEASHHAFCDGRTQLSIPFLVRDHKQVGEGNTGLMTGGMGVVGPLPGYTQDEVGQLSETFVAPIVRELGFKGVLFVGLKGPKDYEKNLEWNARPGDPESQVFMRLMKSELLPLIMACIEGGLDKVKKPEWHIGQSAVSLVLAAEGYPEEPRRGAIIEGLDDAAKIEGVQVLHGGTKRSGRRLLTNGGRVLNLVARAESLEAALEQVYKAAAYIGFDGLSPLYRKDIGRTVLARS